MFKTIWPIELRKGFFFKDFLESLWLAFDGNLPYFTNSFPQKIVFTKNSYDKNWQCCLKRRPREANIFHLHPLASACRSEERFCILFTCAKKLQLLIYMLLMIRWITKQITQHPALKVKQSLYSPWQAQRVPGGWGSQVPRQSAHEGGKVVSPTHRPSLHPRKYSWYSFLLEAESTPGAIMSLKYSNGTNGNRTRDLPTCSAVPQPTAPPRTQQHPALVSRIFNAY